MYLSIVYFATGLLGFLTFSVVTTQYRSNRKVNIYLLILFFFTSTRFLFNGFRVLAPFTVTENGMIVFRSFACLIFPCIYLYFKNLIVNEKYFIKTDLLHFIFPVVFGFLNLLIRKYAINYHICVYFLFSGIALYYFFLSYVELKNKLWFSKAEISNFNESKVLIKNWSIFFFIVCSFSIVRLVITLFLDVHVAGYSRGTNYLWISALLASIVFFKILFTPAALYFTAALSDNKPKKENSELVFNDFWILSEAVLEINDKDLKLKERIDENLLSYVHEFERMALEQLCFRNPAVSMRDFAIKLGIPKSHLIYVFKYHSNVNFIEFKKVVRIFDAINLIEAGFLKSNSLICLSKKTGFSTYDSFLTSFKEITGVNPQEYKKMIKE